MLYIIDINLVVSLCTDYTPGGELVYWKWSHSGGEIGNFLGTWRGKVEGPCGGPQQLSTLYKRYLCSEAPLSNGSRA